MSKADDELFGLKSSRTGEYLHSKSADEMFEELGYKKFLTGYLSPNMRELYGKADKRICFWLDKTIEAYDFYDGGETITMEDLQAINLKVKELRLDRRRR